MKKFAPFLISLAFHASVHAHEFTDVGSGRTLDAEINRATETDVWLKVAGRSISKVSRDRLSEKDQLVIGKWLADQLPSLKISPKFGRGLKPVKSEKAEKGFKPQKKKWESVQTFELGVEIGNYSPDMELEECEVTFFVIGRASADKGVCKVLSKRTQTVSVPPNDEKTLTFDRLENYFSDNKGYHGLSYVLYIKRARDGRQVHLSTTHSFLERKLDAIITREEGDITNSEFKEIVPVDGPEFESEVRVVVEEE